MPQIPIGEWAPDQMALEGAGTVNVNNVIPITIRTYGPIGDLEAATSALVARCRGAAAFRGIDGTIFNTAGDVDSLYTLSDSVPSVTGDRMLREDGSFILREDGSYVLRE